MDRLEAKDGEDDGASVDGSEGVAGGDDEDVLDAVLGRVVVAAKADDGAEGEAKGVKDLGGWRRCEQNFIWFASSCHPSVSAVNLKIQADKSHETNHRHSHLIGCI